MNTFVEAVAEVQVESRTANGAKTWDSSNNALVDLFYTIGSSRGKDIAPLFHRAMAVDSTLALRTLLWARDVRGGAGERATVRSLLTSLEAVNKAALLRILPHLPEYGRWDDLLIFRSADVKQAAYSLIRSAIAAGNGLCCKWMPRKGLIAEELRHYLGLTPKAYRKTLVNGTKVVEQQMCAGEWTSIKYSGVPSLAASRYSSAFKRHDQEGYSAYRQALKSGSATINAAAVYPHDIIKSYRAGADADVLIAQWGSLPNYCGNQLVLPMVDVSGSMSTGVPGSKNLSCLDVSVALGLYLSDKNGGPFKDMFLTFSENSKINRLSGTLVEKINQLERSDWDMNTNLESAFSCILDYAVRGSVRAEDMPAYLLILSDMEFDEAADFSATAYEAAKAQYAAAGYSLPRIVFWNLNARQGNVPVKHNTSGVALVSGFSPSIMQSILASEDFTPMQVMLQTLNSPRYSVL